MKDPSVSLTAASSPFRESLWKMESFGNAECRVHDPSTASGPPSLSGTAAELWGAKLRILSDSVSSDRWSATAYLYCSSGLRNIEDDWECRVQSAKRKVQNEEGVRLSEGIV